MQAVACGVIRTDPGGSVAGAVGRAGGRVGRIGGAVRARRRCRSSGCCSRTTRAPRSRWGRRVGSRSVAAAKAGVPVVQYSPNEVKLAVTGDGRADKRAVQTMVTRLLNLRESSAPARRGGRARAGVLSHVAGAARRAGGPVTRRGTDDRIGARDGDRAHAERRSARRGRRRRLPRARTDLGDTGLASGCARVLVHAPARPRGRDGALRVPDARRTRHVRGVDRRERRRSEARARDLVGAHAEHVAPLPRRGRPCRAHVGARRGEAHRATAARRAEDAARGPRLRPDARCRARRAGARAEVREALTGLGYSTEEVRDALGQLTEDAEVEDLLRDALRLLSGAR